MVRPSVASLNLLAKILRQASPLYAECRSILNYLDAENRIPFLPVVEDPATAIDGVSANKDARSLPQNILELMAPDRKTVM